MKNPAERVKTGLQRAQDQRTERQKIETSAEQQRRKIEQPELPAPRVECKRQQRQQKRQRKQRIRQKARAFDCPSECAQNVIKARKHRAKACGKQKLSCLKSDRKLHQPNSRAKNPPAGTASS